MTSYPRIITVDARGEVARLTRAALDVLGKAVVLIEAPDAAAALEALADGGAALVVTTSRPGPGLAGWELAAKIKAIAEATTVIVVAGPDEIHAGEPDSPFIYLRAPVDGPQFLDLVRSTLNGDAAAAPASEGAIVSQAPPRLPVPPIELKRARPLLAAFMADVGAMAVVLADVNGAVLDEQGALGYVDREQLVATLTPVGRASSGMHAIAGPRTSSLCFYDGKHHDIFLLTIGDFYQVTAVFEGDTGQRQFGGVLRYGRRTVDGLLALLGDAAWLRLSSVSTGVVPAREPVAAPAPVAEAPASATAPGAESPGPPLLDVQPIEADEEALASLFAGDDALPEEDLFQLDLLDQMALRPEPTGDGMSWDQALQNGLLD
jgi:CheY-like chemotaxis protein